MAFFAVLDGNNVINTIVAESKEVAETVTNATCIEYSDKNPAYIGGTYDGNLFFLPILDSAEQNNTNSSVYQFSLDMLVKLSTLVFSVMVAQTAPTRLVRVRIFEHQQ